MSDCKNIDDLKKLRNTQLGFDPENEEDCLNHLTHNVPSHYEFMLVDTEAVRLAAVKNTAYNITLMEEPSVDVCMAAIYRQPSIIKEIKNPTEEMILIAILNGYYDAFMLVDNPSYELCRAVVFQNEYTIDWVTNPSDELLLHVISKETQYSNPIARCRTFKNMTSFSNNVMRALVDKNYRNIQYLNQDTYMKEYALSKSPMSIKYIHDPTYEMCMQAVSGHGGVLQYIENQTIEMCDVALNTSPLSFRWIKTQTPELCKKAVSLHPYNIIYVNDLNMLL